MTRWTRTLMIAGLSLTLGTGAAMATEKTGIGIHGGVGTDINLGLAYGFGVSYVLPASGENVARVEIGPELFFHHARWDETEGITRYIEEISMQVIGIRANLLFNYQDDADGVFYLVGTGFASVGVEWKYQETNIYYPDAWTYDSADGSAAGALLNLGFGYHSRDGLELRLEAPVLFLFNQYGNASSVAPTLTVLAGYRF